MKRCQDCTHYSAAEYEYCFAMAGFNIHLCRASAEDKACGLDAKLYKRKWYLFWRPK